MSPGAVMDFDTAIDRVLSNEGSYVSAEEAARRNDPGGETNWGISKRSFPDVDIAGLTRDTAKPLYRAFWDRIHGDELPNAVAFQALDFAVNSGDETAVRYLQRAAGAADDGHVGEATLAALRATPPAILAMTYIALRLKFMVKLKNWPNASAGWADRIGDDLLLGAQDLL